MSNLPGLQKIDAYYSQVELRIETVIAFTVAGAFIPGTILLRIDCDNWNNVDK